MQISRALSCRVTTGALLLGGFAGSAGAQGFGLSEIGTCAVGRGFAVTAAVCKDASVIYWNPAAATRLPRKTVTIGDALIKVGGGFRQDTTNTFYKADAPAEFPPHAFGNYTWGRWAAGLGVYVPYGLTSQWKQDFPGRFLAQKASLQTIYVQPNIAYALTPNWSIGIGPVFGHSSVELRQGVDLSEQTLPNTTTTFGQVGIPLRTEFARAQLKGSGNAVGVNIGIHGQITPEWVFGARYLSAMKFKYKDADVSFEQVQTGIVLPVNHPLRPQIPNGPIPLDPVLTALVFTTGPLVAQKGNSEIPHPWQAQAGIGYTGFTGTTLSFDISRVGWSAFKNLPLEFEGPASDNSRVLFEDYKDSWAFRAGVEHVLQQQGMWQGWALRGGFSHATAPAPDETVSPLLPDIDRNNLSLGIGIPLSPRYTLDASYLHVGTPGRRGRISDRTDRAQTAQQLNTGSYEVRANVFSISLTASF